jgi:hypothetical protein
MISVRKVFFHIIIADANKILVLLYHSAEGGGELFSGDGSGCPFLVALLKVFWARVMSASRSFTFGKSK